VSRRDGVRVTHKNKKAIKGQKGSINITVLRYTMDVVNRESEKKASTPTLIA
jgi:hypothetical protein